VQNQEERKVTTLIEEGKAADVTKTRTRNRRKTGGIAAPSTHNATRIMNSKFFQILCMYESTYVCMYVRVCMIDKRMVHIF
jgi:hypothetical protein